MDKFSSQVKRAVCALLVISFLVPVDVGLAENAGITEPERLTEVQTLARGLDSPWAMDFAPDGRIFLTERTGRIRIVANGELRPEPFMSLNVTSAGEAGLLGLALDPDFTINRRMYVALTHSGRGNEFVNRLVRVREDRATGQGVPDGVLLDNIAGAGNHNGGRVRFGPDGKLYWSIGDAGTEQRAQDPASLNGKVLRLNTDGSVPLDNPTPGSPVYTLGHRNVQGLAWQPGTNALYVTEHGPSGSQGCCRDEVNALMPGANYGWPIIKGDERLGAMSPPVYHSGSSDTWAPSGATFITRGPWAGSLLFTGLRGQSLYRLVFDPTDSHRALGLERYLERKHGRLRDVQEGPDGALYLLTSNRDGFGAPGPEDDRLLRIVVR